MSKQIIERVKEWYKNLPERLGDPEVKWRVSPKEVETLLTLALEEQKLEERNQIIKLAEEWKEKGFEFTTFIDSLKARKVGDAINKINL